MFRKIENSSRHITAKPEQIARALEIGEMTFDEIDEHRARGIELLGPVRGFCLIVIGWLGAIL